MSYIAKRVVTAIVIIAIVAVVGLFIWNNFFNSEPEITNKFISNQLRSVSDLTTAELSYNGLVTYTDGDIPILTKKAFMMTYFAEVKAGIDMSKVKVNVTESSVEIYLPKVEIQDINIKPDSIVFYDSKAALFNWSKKEDVIDAMKVAKKDVTQKGGMETLKAKAKDRAKTLIIKLFEKTIGDRELIVDYK